MLPIKFWLNLTYGWEEMLFELFQGGRHGSQLGYQNETILAILNLYVPPMPPIKVWLNPTFWRRCRFGEFQNGRHGGHLEYRNGTLVAILNLYVAPMPSIKIRLSLTYGFGEDVV